MTRHLQKVYVEISNSLGNVFRGYGNAVSVQTAERVTIEFRPDWLNYVSLSEQAELTVQHGTEVRRFLLKNAMGRLDRDKLSILAETVISADEEKPGALRQYVE
jgi:hypothetical protein